MAVSEDKRVVFQAERTVESKGVIRNFDFWVCFLKALTNYEQSIGSKYQLDQPHGAALAP